MLPRFLMTALLSVGQAHAADDQALVLRNHPQIQQAVFHPDGKRVYFVTRGGVEAYDATTGQRLFHGVHGGDLGVSPDGKKLALVRIMRGMISIGGTIVVLDADTGKEQHRLAGTYAEFGPDGRWLISHSNYQWGRPEYPPPKVQVTDLKTGKTHLAPLKKEASYHFTKDGKTLVSHLRDKVGQWKTLAACDLATGKEIDLLPKDDELFRLHDSRSSDDGKRFTDKWSVFDANGGKLIAKLEMPKALGTHSWRAVFQISPDGKEVFSVSHSPWQPPAEKDDRVPIGRRSHLHVWDAETGKWKRAVQADFTCTLPPVTFKNYGSRSREDPHFAFNRQCTLAISYDNFGVVTVWDLAQGKALRKFREGGHSSLPELLAFNADGSWLASASTDGEVVLWDAKSGKSLRTMEQAPYLGDLQFRPKSKELVGVGFDLICVWNAETGRLLRSFERKGNASKLAFHPDGKIVAVVNQWADVGSLLDIETGKVVHELRAGGVQSLQFHPDGKSLMTMDRGGNLCLWDVITGQKLATWLDKRQANYDHRAHQATFNADGSRIFIHENYRTFVTLDAKTGKKIAERTIEKEVFSYASWHPDGKRIVVSYHHGEKAVEERDLATGKLLRTYGQHPYQATAVLYNPAGTRLATSGYDYVVRIHPTPKAAAP